jgi:antitoxin YefM
LGIRQGVAIPTATSKELAPKNIDVTQDERYRRVLADPDGFVRGTVLCRAVLCCAAPTFPAHPNWYAIRYYYEEAIMSAMTVTEARKSLFGLIQQVNADHTVVEIVSRHGNAVILSKDDYDAITETAYLLRNPANAERLLTAIERARRGEFERRDLIVE